MGRVGSLMSPLVLIARSPLPATGDFSDPQTVASSFAQFSEIKLAVDVDLRQRIAAALKRGKSLLNASSDRARPAPFLAGMAPASKFTVIG